MSECAFRRCEWLTLTWILTRELPPAHAHQTLFNEMRLSASYLSVGTARK